MKKLATGAEDEPKPTYHAFGMENRVPGKILWFSKAKPLSTCQRRLNSTATYTYSVDIAIEAGPEIADGVKKVWANGTLIYDSTPNISKSKNKRAKKRRRKG